MKKLFIKLVILMPIFNSNILAQVNFSGPELLGKPTNNSITINVVPDANIYELYYEYGILSGVYTGQTVTGSATANQPYEIVISGLSSDTKYYYRMQYRTSAGGSWIARTEHTFHTQREKGSSFKFDITSDSHAQLNSYFRSALQNVNNDQPDFLIDLGDTFMTDYDANQSSVNTEYMAYRNSLYFGAIGSSVPIFLASGNHENEEGWNLDDTPFSIAQGSIQARKLYFPTPTSDGFYSGNTDPLAAIDQNTYGDKLREDYYAWEWGDALFIVIDEFQYTMTNPYGAVAGESNDDPASGDQWNWTLGQQQFNWFKQVLDTSSAKYKFVFSHNMVGGIPRAISVNPAGYVRGGAEAAPYFEWGGKNANGTEGFDTHRPGWGGVPIHQLLIDNGGSAYFHGHDHLYAYESLDGIVYQEVPSPSMTGSGFGGIYSTSNSYTHEILPNAGHLRVTITPDSATVEYVRSYPVNENGNVSYTYVIYPPTVTCKARIFLEGPYLGSSTMDTELNTGIDEFLKNNALAQSYHGAPWNYNGLESVGSTFFASNPNIVDWVLLELRKGETAATATTVATKAAFIKSDGNIVDIDGTSPVEFKGRPAGDYYIVVRHRNHLAVMSSVKVSLPNSTTYDFTTSSSQFYGGNAGAKDLGSGVWGMIAGDGNGNGEVQNDDSENIWKPGNGTSGYKNADYNMNGQVQNDDNENYWKLNNGKGSQVP